MVITQEELFCLFLLPRYALPISLVFFFSFMNIIVTLVINFVVPRNQLENSVCLFLICRTHHHLDCEIDQIYMSEHITRISLSAHTLSFIRIDLKYESVAPSLVSHLFDLVTFFSKMDFHLLGVIQRRKKIHFFFADFYEMRCTSPSTLDMEDIHRVLLD